MSWDDYVFEDPMESYDRGLEEDEPTKRKCKKCENEFLTTYACACPRCGGWTEILDGE